MSSNDSDSEMKNPAVSKGGREIMLKEADKEKLAQLEAMYNSDGIKRFWYDVALPQEFSDEIQRITRYVLLNAVDCSPCPRFVWVYTTKHPSGFPLCLNSHAVIALEEFIFSGGYPYMIVTLDNVTTYLNELGLIQ